MSRGSIDRRMREMVKGGRSKARKSEGKIKMREQDREIIIYKRFQSCKVQKWRSLGLSHFHTTAPVVGNTF